MNNTLNVNFEEGKVIAKAGGLWQWDKGQKMRIFGTGIRSDVETHFSLMEKGGSSKKLVAAYDGGLDALVADIPNSFLANESLIDYKLYAFLYVRGEGTAETVYKIILTVKARPKPEGYEEDSTNEGTMQGFKVTFTSREISMDPVTYAFTYETACDKTLAEIWEAFSSGQYVYAEHKILRPADPNSEYPEGTVIENGSVVSKFYCNVIDGRHDSFTFGRSLVCCSHPDDLTIPHSWFALVDNLQIYFDYPTSQEVCSYVDTGTTIPVLGEVSELFPVTFDDEDLGNTTAAYSVTCDKTFSQVKTAIENGKHVFAVIRKHYGQTVSTYYYPMLRTLGTSITFGSITPSSVGSPPYSRWEIRKYVLESSGATAQGYNESFARKGDFDALAASAAESFKVTVTDANSGVTADKTFSEIKAAIDAGEYVYVAYQRVQEVGGEPTVTETQHMPLTWCWGGQYIRFSLVAHGNNGYTVYSVDFWPEEEAQQYGVNPVDYGFATYQFARQSALDALAQQVSGLSAHGVGEDCHGKTIEYYDEVTHQTETMTGGTGAECFNDYEDNKPIGNYSHAEGCSTEAWGTYSHAEGYYTRAGDQSTFGECDGAHAEGGYAIAKKEYSHAEGYGTIAGSREQHVQGHYNIEDEYQTYADIIGNGTGDNARSNAQTTSWSGVLWTASDVRCGGTDMDDLTMISLVDLAQRIAALEQAIGNT